MHVRVPCANFVFCASPVRVCVFVLAFGYFQHYLQPITKTHDSPSLIRIGYAIYDKPGLLTSLLLVAVVDVFVFVSVIVRASKNG